METPLPCPSPTCPTYCNCFNLSHLTAPPVLSQLPFLSAVLRFCFWVSDCHSTFWKRLLTKYFLQSAIMLKSVNNQQISTKRQPWRQPWPGIHSNTWLCFVSVEFNSCTLWHQNSKQTLFESVKPYTKSLLEFLMVFRRVGLRRRHCTQPFDVTCVGLGTERDHSVSSLRGPILGTYSDRGF